MLQDKIDLNISYFFVEFFLANINIKSIIVLVKQYIKNLDRLTSVFYFGN